MHSGGVAALIDRDSRRLLQARPRPGGRCGIAVMAKASIPGRTKTRLMPTLSASEAASLNTAFLMDVSANLLAAGRSAGIQGYMAFGPPETRRFFADVLPPEIGLIEAWFPDFGDCLFKAIADLLAGGHESAVVLNSDSPTLPTALLVEAAGVLGRPGDRAVLGPSTDGGYYLLGLKRAHRRLFEDIDWSTEHVACQSLERAREIGLQVHRLPVWYDVDDVSGLRRLSRELLEDGPIDGTLIPYHAQHTAALMRKLAASNPGALPGSGRQALERAS
jgi:rSAM/selenodomain-associated transferase 1